MANSDDSWYEKYLGHERFTIFLSAAGKDRPKAVALVDWDIQMRGELHKALGEWEVALRNRYDTVLRSWWSGQSHWLLDPQSPVQRPLFHQHRDVNERSRVVIAKAFQRARKDTAPEQDVPIGKVIANLTLDFWRYLSSTSREKSLWVPVLHRAFPRGSDRVKIDHQIDQLYRLRNRIAHHEPIFRKPIKFHTTNLVHGCELICPPLADLIQERGTIAKLWHARPVELL